MIPVYSALTRAPAPCALLLSSEQAVEQCACAHERILVVVAGVPLRFLEIGPLPSECKVLENAGLTLDQMDLIALKDAFGVRGWRSRVSRGSTTKVRV
jgi:acetyl-CoA acetyltransferase